jgi:hypothetical protein
MPSTYTLIKSETVGIGGAASVTFNSIPATYKDLLIKLSTRTNAAATVLDYIEIRPNAATSLISGTRIQGNGAAATSNRFTVMYLPVPGATATANSFGNAEIYISNYASSDYKCFSYDAAQETNAVTAYFEVWAGLWSNTAAITSLVLGNSGSNFVQYSTIDLYGIKNT